MNPRELMLRSKPIVYRSSIRTDRGILGDMSAEYRLHTRIRPVTYLRHALTPAIRRTRRAYLLLGKPALAPFVEDG